MDIHKPKPVHSWRELLTEIGVIVIGVAIALAGEQAVETLHNRNRAAEARAGIREEIAHNLAWMDRREGTEACISKRLDEIDGLIAASAAGKLPQEPLWIGMPVDYISEDGTFKTALQSGAASLFDDNERATYADTYSKFDVYNQRGLEEIKAWGDLRTLEKHPSPTPALDVMLRRAMQKARTARLYIELMRNLVHDQAASIGIKPDRLEPAKMVPSCIPLNTPREEALKQMAAMGFNLRFP